MTTSLLWSALLMATFLGPVNGNAISTAPVTSQPEQQNTEPSSILYPSSTDSTEVVESTTAHRKLTTAEVTTPALSSASTAKPSTCPTPQCDCLLGITEGRDAIGLLMFGGLILGCLGLLITTMTLACKLCHIQRHYRDYQICHVDASPANGRAKAKELNDSSIPMSEVSKDERTARDSAENNQSKEKKEKEEEKEKEKANGGSAQSSVDEASTAKSHETAAPDNSDANEGTANKAKQPESSGEETTKTPAATATTTDTDNKAEDEADGAKSVEEETKTEAATVEKSTTEA